MKKKVLLLLLTLTLALSACGNDAAPESTDDTTVSTDAIETTDSTETTDVEETTPEADLVTIEEQLLYDQDGIKISATGLLYTENGQEVLLYFQNETDTDVHFGVSYLSVNGYMFNCSAHEVIMAGLSKEVPVTLNPEELSTCGITEIANVEVTIRYYEEGSSLDSTYTEPLMIKTSIADTYVQTYDDSGELVYDDNDVKIISKGLSGDPEADAYVTVYIENNTDQTITVQTDDVFVNGERLYPTFSPQITPGNKILTTITLAKINLEGKGVLKIETVDISFLAFYEGNFHRFVETRPITITF